MKKMKKMTESETSPKEEMTGQEEYLRPELEIVRFSAADVITSSPEKKPDTETGEENLLS